MANKAMFRKYVSFIHKLFTTERYSYLDAFLLMLMYELARGELWVACVICFVIFSTMQFKFQSKVRVKNQ